MPVITISGGLASGAREVAQAAARELGIDYVDQEIMVEAARQLGVKVADVEERDERKSSIGERMAGVLRTLMERSAAAGAADPLAGGSLEMVLARTYGEAADLPDAGGGLNDERYLKTLASVIKGIAARGNVIILGRGSQAILHDLPGALHVWVAAPLEHRIALLIERDDVSKHDAERRIKQSDQHRQAFHRHYFKVEPDAPALYDMGINAARIGFATAAKMIALAAQDKAPRPG
jgi:cytidylate kinase